jgi:hypothetical protein
LPAKRRDEISEHDHVGWVHVHLVLVRHYDSFDRNDLLRFHRPFQPTADFGLLPLSLMFLGLPGFGAFAVAAWFGRRL